MSEIHRDVLRPQVILGALRSASPKNLEKPLAVEIPLSRGLFALVDEADAEEVLRCTAFGRNLPLSCHCELTYPARHPFFTQSQTNGGPPCLSA